MAFIALNAQTGERIDITRIEKPRETLQPGQLVCQLCQQAMVIKVGMIKQPHFAHKGTQCTTDYQYHPETAVHHDAKIYLVEHLRKTFEEYTLAIFDYEVPLPEIWRVADILVTFPMGWRIGRLIADVGCGKYLLHCADKHHLPALDAQARDGGKRGIGRRGGRGFLVLGRSNVWHGPCTFVEAFSS